MMKNIVSVLRIYLENDDYNICITYNDKESLDIITENDMHLLMNIMMPLWMEFPQ